MARFTISHRASRAELGNIESGTWDTAIEEFLSTPKGQVFCPSELIAEPDVETLEVHDPRQTVKHAIMTQQRLVFERDEAILKLKRLSEETHHFECDMKGDIIDQPMDNLHSLAMAQTVVMGIAQDLEEDMTPEQDPTTLHALLGVFHLLSQTRKKLTTKAG